MVAHMSEDIIKQLQAVLNQVDDIPALINSLPHDLLRKIILLVGMQEYAYVNGVRHRIDDLIYALETDTQPNYSTYIGLFHCDTCYHAEIIGDGYDPSRMQMCSCVHYEKYICNDCIKERNSPNNYACSECVGLEHA
jgi:hypothetical protein